MNIIIIHLQAYCPAKRRHFKTAQSYRCTRLYSQTGLTDIILFLPNGKTRLWVLAYPRTGFAETFSHYLMDVSPGGGSNQPDNHEFAKHIIFVTSVTGKIKGNGDGLFRYLFYKDVNRHMNLELAK